MKRDWMFAIITVLCAMPSVAQERIVAMDGNGRGVYADSLRMRAIEWRVRADKATIEGYKLQKSSGLDQKALATQLSPIKLQSPNVDVDNYVDTLAYRYPDVSVPSHYAVTGRYEDMLWQRNPMAYDFNREGKIASWYDGYVTGMSGKSTAPMLGSVRWAGATATQNFGEHWQVMLGATAQKYNLPALAYNTYSFNGQVMYTLNRNVGVSVFGQYESSPFFSHAGNVRPSMLYGGYLTLKTNNDKWGVDMGAQTYRDPVTGRGATVPIFRPFYNLNGQKLGIDLGGLLYQIFESLSVKCNGSGSYDYNGTGGVPANMLPVSPDKALGFEHSQGRYLPPPR